MERYFIIMGACICALPIPAFLFLGLRPEEIIAWGLFWLVCGVISSFLVHFNNRLWNPRE